MYIVRVAPDGESLTAEFSGEMTTAEALRAVSQAFTLAEAGNIARALCDLRAMDSGPTPSLSIIAASFAARCEPGQRIAMLCSNEQLHQARKFARFARVGEELGVFTRKEDAEAWLATGPSGRLSRTALQHLGALDSTVEAPPAERERRASA